MFPTTIIKGKNMNLVLPITCWLANTIYFCMQILSSFLGRLLFSLPQANFIYNQPSSSWNWVVDSINLATQLPIKIMACIISYTLLHGYDLLGYINGNLPCPPTTITKGENWNLTLPSTCGLAKKNYFSMQFLSPFMRRFTR